MEHEFNRHHRKPRSKNGSDDKRNVVMVAKIHHDAWHTLFANKSAVEITEIINSTWLDPDFKMIVVKEKEYNQTLFYLNLMRDDI